MRVTTSQYEISGKSQNVFRRVSPLSLGVTFTRARVSLALLSLRENGEREALRAFSPQGQRKVSVITRCPS